MNEARGASRRCERAAIWAASRPGARTPHRADAPKHAHFVGPTPRATHLVRAVNRLKPLDMPLTPEPPARLAMPARALPLAGASSALASHGGRAVLSAGSIETLRITVETHGARMPVSAKLDAKRLHVASWALPLPGHLRRMVTHVGASVEASSRARAGWRCTAPLPGVWGCSSG